MTHIDIFNFMKPKCWIIGMLIVLGFPSAMNSSDGDNVHSSYGLKGEFNFLAFLFSMS